MKPLQKAFTAMTLGIFLLSSCSTRGQYSNSEIKRPHLARQSAEVLKGVAGLIVLGAFAIIFHDSHKRGHGHHHRHHGGCH